MKGVYKEIFFFFFYKKFSGTTDIAAEISGRSLPQKNYKQHMVSALAKRTVGW
jgi:hypothetical protein